MRPETSIVESEEAVERVAIKKEENVPATGATDENTQVCPILSC